MLLLVYNYREQSIEILMDGSCKKDIMAIGYQLIQVFLSEEKMTEKRIRDRKRNKWIVMNYSVTNLTNFSLRQPKC